MKMRKPRLALAGAGAALIGLLAGAAVAQAAAIAGPSSSGPPYLLGSQPGVLTKSILTVGDSVNAKPDGVTPYRMVGIPDGLGTFDKAAGADGHPVGRCGEGVGTPTAAGGHR